MWSSNFGGKICEGDAYKTDSDCYQNRYGFQKLREIESLIFALQIVWEEDLTIEDVRNRLEGRLDGLVPDGDINIIMNDWKAVRHTSLETSSDSGTGAAKKYAASIISSKIIGEQIAIRIQSLKYIFEGYPDSTPMNTPAALRAQINGLGYLSDSHRNELLETIDVFEEYYNKMKTDVVDYLHNVVGDPYLDPTNQANRQNICPDDVAKLGFLNRIACFEWCGGVAFDQCIKSDSGAVFPKTFESMMKPLSAIENIEDSLSWLTEKEEEIDGVSSIQENVDNLKPEIRTEALKLNENLVNDIEAKVTGKIKGILNKYNPDKEGGIDESNPGQKVQLFSGDGNYSFKDFAKSLVGSPLSFLQERFTNIGTASQTIKRNLEYANTYLPSFFGGNRYSQYSNAISTVRNTKMDNLTAMISGNEEIKPACSALGILLNGNLTEMDRVCRETTDNGGELRSAWLAAHNNQDFIKKCEAWLDLDIEDAAELQKLKTSLEEQRSCIATEQCAYGGKPCLVCPKWFCIGNNGFWGANAIKEDLYCKQLCDSWAPGQNTGYVCDFANNIIWDTTVAQSQISDSDRARANICADAGFGSVCTVVDLKSRCNDFNNKVKNNMGVFDQYSSQQVANVQQIQTLQKELSCIAYENCAYGYDTNFFSSYIKTTTIGGKIQPCITCPKWICANPDGSELPYGNDPYCIAKQEAEGVSGQNVNGLSWNFDNSNKIWDSTWPVGLRKWPRETACFSSDKSTRQTNTFADKYSRNLNGTPVNQLSITGACIQKQKELQALVDSGGAVIAALPWDTENWPCKTKEECETLQNVCSMNSGDWVNVQSGWNQWPPQTKCKDSDGSQKTGNANNFEGARTLCIQTQRQMSMLDALIDNANSDKTKELLTLTDDCSELERQKQLKEECDNYALAKYAVKNNCSASGDSSACRNIRKKMSSICTVRDKNGNLYRKDEFCNGSNIKDITSEGNAEGMKKLRRLCIESNDIATPLNEVMKVLSILMGIQSGTAAHGGIVTSIKGAQIFYQNAGKFIKMIEGLKDAMGKAYENEMKKDAPSSGGIKITPFKCVAAPAESYAGNKSQPLSGSKGGPVCPEVSGLYSQLQAQFSQIRQQSKEIFKLYYKAEEKNIALPWGDAYLHLYTSYENTYPSIKPLYDRADQLKQSAQFVWALATAVNFASENCTCGMSYCKIPFCISGLPLTLAPLKDPDCALVWMLRSPMVNMAKQLGEDLMPGSSQNPSNTTPPSLSCTDGACDTTTRKYCDARTWTPADDSLYCSKCNHCSDGYINCGEAGVDCDGGGCGRCTGDITPPTIKNVKIFGAAGNLFTITAEIVDSSGIEADTAQSYIKNFAGKEVAMKSLYDDSLHSDGGKDDGVYGNEWDSTGLGAGPYFVDIMACDSRGNCTKSKSSKTQEQINALIQLRACNGCVPCPAWICEGANDPYCAAASRCEDNPPQGGRKVCKTDNALFDVSWPKKGRIVPSGARKNTCLQTQKEINALESNASGVPYWEAALQNTIQ